jgi:hypothetical protein
MRLGKTEGDENGSPAGTKVSLREMALQNRRASQQATQAEV